MTNIDVLKEHIKYYTDFFDTSEIFLCKEEIFNNKLYGHAKVLKMYAGMDLSKPMVGYLQHGWSYENGVPGYEPRDKERPPKFFLKRSLLWSERMLNRHRALGFNSSILIGSPFIYLPEIKMGYEKKNSIILFPPHSTNMEPFFDQEKFFKKYLKDIAKVIEKNFGDITICLGERDFNTDGIKEIFKNYNVITLGNRLDSNFLIKFQLEVERHEYVSSNRLQTALVYALHMGKKVFILGDAGNKYKAIVPWQQHGPRPPDFRKEYSQLLWENFDDKCHKEVSDIELGVEYKRTPEKLRKILSA